METSILDLGTVNLVYILRFLSAKDCARASCVHKDWKAWSEDEILWQTFLRTDFGVDSPTKLSGEIANSYKAAYSAWYRDVGHRYGCQLVKRAHVAWTTVKGWLAEHFPAVLPTLRPGVSDEELDEAERELGLGAFPPALRLMYRFHNGQDLAYEAILRQSVLDNRSVRIGDTSSLFLGMFGGYSVYDHLVVCRFLSVQNAVWWTHRKLAQLDPSTQTFNFPTSAFIVSASFNMSKVTLVELATGSVRMASMQSNCIANAAPNTGADSLLTWFETYASRLSGGMYGLCQFLENTPSSLSIQLFPLRPPDCVTAVTRCVQVSASTVYATELSNTLHNVFPYSIRFRLLSLEEQEAAWPASSGPFRPMQSCQLRSRHWLILAEDERVANEVSGDAVVGEYPLLSAGGPEFVYQSCTEQKQHTIGAMTGDFTFVEGSLEKPIGAPFRVFCPKFILKIPDFIF